MKPEDAYCLLTPHDFETSSSEEILTNAGTIYRRESSTNAGTIYRREASTNAGTIYRREFSTNTDNTGIVSKEASTNTDNQAISNTTVTQDNCIKLKHETYDLGKLFITKNHFVAKFAELFCLSALIYFLAIQFINRGNPTDQIVILSILLSFSLIIQIAQRIRLLNTLNIINKQIEKSEDQELKDVSFDTRHTVLEIIDQLIIFLCNLIRRTRTKIGKYITLHQIGNIAKFEVKEQILLLTPILTTSLLYIALMSDYVLFQYTTIDTTIYSLNSVFSTVNLLDVRPCHLVMLLFIYLLVVEILSLIISSYIKIQDCDKRGDELKANQEYYLNSLIVFKILLNPIQFALGLFETASRFNEIERENRSLNGPDNHLEISKIQSLLISPNILTI